VVVLILGLRTPYTPGDFEHKKIKEIEEEVDIINDKFRDLGYFWILKKREKFEIQDEVPPPKDTFDTDDEDEIRGHLTLKKKKKGYILHKEKLRLIEQGLLKEQEKLMEGIEESTDSESEEEEEEKKQKEIVEVWYLKVEKNF
jgi:hypothetical protein